MTPETRETVALALAHLHDYALDRGRAMQPKEEYPYGRRVMARDILRVRRAMRELRNPINLPRNDCE